MSNDQHLYDRLARVLGRTPTHEEKLAAYVGKKHSIAADGGMWVCTSKVIKYDPDSIELIKRSWTNGVEPDGNTLRAMETAGLVEPDEVLEGVGNLLVTVGLNRITNLIIGGGGAAMNNAQMFCGVGDSTTAAAVGDTALGAATNKYYQGIDATYPTQSNGVISANCTFASGNANYAWQEWVWGVATGTLTAGTTPPGTSPIIINHKVQSLGTKVTGSVWTLQASITIS